MYRWFTTFLAVGAVVVLSLFAAKAYGDVREEWVARNNGSGNGEDQACDIAVDNSGNVYVTGRSWNGSNYDYLTKRYGPCGQLIWEERYNAPGNGNDTARAIVVYADGVFVTGEGCWHGGHSQYVTIRYDRYDGHEDWVNNYGMVGNADKAYGIAAGSGKVCVTGECWSGNTCDCGTVCYDAVSGNQEWAHEFNGTPILHLPDYGAAIAVDGNYVCVAGGSFRFPSGMDYLFVSYELSNGNERCHDFYNGIGIVNSFDFAWGIAMDGGYAYVTGGSEQGVGAQSDYVTIKYRVFDCLRIWDEVARYTAPENDRARAIAVYGDALYVTGESWTGSSYDYTTVRYDAADGHEEEVEHYDFGDDDKAKDIAVDGDGVYVTGGSEGNGSEWDYATVAYRHNLDSWWEMRYDGPANDDDKAHAIAVDDAGNVYVTGESEGVGTGLDFATIKYSEFVLPTPAYVVCPDGSGDFCTVQAAIDYASDGDTILLCDATFTGDANRDIDFLGKAITVMSQSGDPEACIIYCEDAGRGFYFHSGEDSNSVLAGVTIKDGRVSGSPPKNRGGGIRCVNSHPTIQNCLIVSCAATNGYGGAICCDDFSHPVIDSCTIHNNGAYFGWGVSCINSSPTLTRCTISRDSGLVAVPVVSKGGGLYVVHLSSPELRECVITRCVAAHGGAVYCDTSSSPILTHCTISENSGGLGGMVYCGSGSSPTFNSTIVAFSTSGYGIYFSDCLNAVVEYCDVDSNDDGDFGGDVPPGLGIPVKVNYNGDSCDYAYNVSCDPLFQDLYPGDYHLAGESCCIDAGYRGGYDEVGVIERPPGHQENDVGDPGDPGYDDTPNDTLPGYEPGDRPKRRPDYLQDPDGTPPDIGAFYFHQGSGRDPVCGEVDGIRESDDAIAADYFLDQNYPNPFNPMTTIRYNLPQAGQVKIAVYNILGRQVTTLVNEFRPAGSYSVIWNATNVPSGTYFVQMRAGDYHPAIKLVVLK